MPTKADNTLKNKKNTASISLVAATILLSSTFIATAQSDAPEIAWPKAMQERGDLIPKDQKRVKSITKPTTDFPFTKGFRNDRREGEHPDAQRRFHLHVRSGACPSPRGAAPRYKHGMTLL